MRNRQQAGVGRADSSALRLGGTVVRSTRNHIAVLERRTTGALRDESTNCSPTAVWLCTSAFRSAGMSIPDSNDIASATPESVRWTSSTRPTSVPRYVTLRSRTARRPPADYRHPVVPDSEPKLGTPSNRRPSPAGEERDHREEGQLKPDSTAEVHWSVPLVKVVRCQQRVAGNEFCAVPWACWAAAGMDLAAAQQCGPIIRVRSGCIRRCPGEQRRVESTQRHVHHQRHVGVVTAEPFRKGVLGEGIGGE